MTKYSVSIFVSHRFVILKKLQWVPYGDPKRWSSLSYSSSPRYVVTSSNALRVLQGGLPAFPVTHTHTHTLSFLSPFYILKASPPLVLAELLCGLLCETTQSTTAI